jgi:hypothetical protein
MMQDCAGSGAENELFVVGDTAASDDDDTGTKFLLFLQNGITDGRAWPVGKLDFDLSILLSFYGIN